MLNKEYWDKLKLPPPEALKKIKGGRLSGMTDISPQWRFEIMTDIFGPIGIGWNFKLIRQWLEATESGEVCAFTNIELKYKHDNEWSEWIPGTGGSKFIASETKGLHVSDECFKMSLTDALSVAMKSIGVGADVYQGKLNHDSKYETRNYTGEGTEKKAEASQKGLDKVKEETLDQAKKALVWMNENNKTSQLDIIQDEYKNKALELMDSPTLRGFIKACKQIKDGKSEVERSVHPDLKHPEDLK